MRFKVDPLILRSLRSLRSIVIITELDHVLPVPWIFVWKLLVCCFNKTLFLLSEDLRHRINLLSNHLRVVHFLESLHILLRSSFKRERVREALLYFLHSLWDILEVLNRSVTPIQWHRPPMLLARTLHSLLLLQVCLDVRCDESVRISHIDSMVLLQSDVRPINLRWGRRVRSLPLISHFK